MKSEKVDEELIRQQIELSKKLFEIDPGMAKKVILVARSEMERLKKLQIEAEKKFKIGSVHMDAERFTTAVSNFATAIELRTEIGDEEGQAMALEMQVACFLKIGRGMTDAARKRAEKAIEIYEKIGSTDGINKVKSLIKEIEQKEKDEMDAEMAERTMGQV